jgi:predicted methyltransferase
LKKIEKYILRELASSEKSFWGLLEHSRFPLKDLIGTIGELKRKGLIKVDETGLNLTEKGRRNVDKNSLSYTSEICAHCLGKRILAGGKFRDILPEFKKVAKDRPSPSLAFFQGYMKEEDVIARAALMHWYGDLLHRDVVLIGDDDLLSVVLSLTGMPSRICVLDADERLGDFLKAVNENYGFDIEFREYDVAGPLPEDLIGSFDLFSSEPLESIGGLKAFVGRGVSCLRENGTGYFGLTTLEASYKKWIAIERLLTEMNCVITDIIKDFSRYPMDYGTVNYESFVGGLKFSVGKNPGVDWYRSTLFRFEALGKPKSIIPPNKKLRISHVDREEDITHPWALQGTGR